MRDREREKGGSVPVLVFGMGMGRMTKMRGLSVR